MDRKEAIRFAEYAQILADGKPDVQEFYRLAEIALRDQEERRWIPVAERLPESNMPVLVYCTNITIQGGYTIHIGSFDMGKFWFLRTRPGISSFPVREWQVTNWMPMPEPPKE